MNGVGLFHLKNERTDGGWGHTPQLSGLLPTPPPSPGRSPCSRRRDHTHSHSSGAVPIGVLRQLTHTHQSNTRKTNTNKQGTDERRHTSSPICVLRHRRPYQGSPADTIHPTSYYSTKYENTYGHPSKKQAQHNTHQAITKRLAVCARDMTPKTKYRHGILSLPPSPLVDSKSVKYRKNLGGG